MNLGDRILLPITVKERPVAKKKCFCGEDEIGFIRSLVLHKVFMMFIPCCWRVKYGVMSIVYSSWFAVSLSHRCWKQDSEIIVVNKPPGLPVQVSLFVVLDHSFVYSFFFPMTFIWVLQGGIGIRTSLDELAISCLSFGSPEPPRLVSLFWS